MQVDAHAARGAAIVVLILSALYTLRADAKLRTAILTHNAALIIKIHAGNALLHWPRRFYNRLDVIPSAVSRCRVRSLVPTPEY